MSIGDLRNVGLLPRGLPAADPGAAPVRRGSMGALGLATAAPELRLARGDGGGAAPLPRSLSQRSLKAAAPEMRTPVFANAAAKEAYARTPGQQSGPRLADGNAVLAKLGQPMPHTKLFGGYGPTLQNSTTRRAMMGALDGYKTALNTQTLASAGKPRASQIEGLAKHLATAEVAVDKYLAKRFGGMPAVPPHGADATTLARFAKRDFLREVKADIGRERATLTALAKDGGPSGGAPVPLGLAVRLAAQGFPLAVARDAQAFSQAHEVAGSREVLGSGAVNTVSKVSYIGRAEPMVYKPLASGPGAVVDTGKNIGIDESDPRYGQRNLATSILAKALGLDIVADTHLASHGEELGLVMEFAKGKAPNQNDPKALPISDAERATIRRDQTSLVGNLAGAARAQERGDLLDDFKGAKELQGLSVDAASGEWRKHASVADSFDVQHDPSLMRQLADLEVLDKACGQVDRHTGNYLVHQTRGDDGSLSSKLTAIDNDLSFGSRSVNPGQARGHAVGWPTLMSSKMAVNLRSLEASWREPGGTRAQLAALLTPPELAATESRLFGNPDAHPPIKGLVQHGRDLAAQGRVIRSGDWDKPTVVPGGPPGGPPGPTPFEIATAAGSRNSHIAKLHSESVSAARAKA